MEQTKATIARRADGTWLPHQGNHGNRRAGNYYAKGRQGFLLRPVVIIKPTGEAIHLPSVVAAQKYLGLRNRQMVTRAIRNGYAKRGYKLMYREDFSPLADYSFRVSELRDDEGRATPAMMRRYRMMQEKNMTDEQRRKKSERSRRQSIEMAADPNSRWGKGFNRFHPIHCETNGKDYQSMKEASKDLGIPSSQISMAIKRCGTTHGYKFYDKALWDRIELRIKKIMGKEDMQ